MSATFECLKVEINRPWLRNELFYDTDLKPAKDKLISPGPTNLAMWMDPVSNTPGHKFGDVIAQETLDSYKAKLADYSLFPFFPSSFLVAAKYVSSLLYMKVRS